MNTGISTGRQKSCSVFKIKTLCMKTRAKSRISRFVAFVAFFSANLSKCVCARMRVRVFNYLLLLYLFIIKS